jgi:hypothetical protein
MKTTKQIVNVRLTPEQVKRINDRIAGSSLLDQSKFIRLAVEWLLVNDLGEVIAILEARQ